MDETQKSIINIDKIKSYNEIKEYNLETTPTVGYSIEYFRKNNVNFTVFDMSG